MRVRCLLSWTVQSPFLSLFNQTWISLHEVGFPLIVQIKVFICVTSRAEDSKLGRWWSAKRPTCSDVADGAIEQGYGSKRGSIPEGRREVASLVVVVLRLTLRQRAWGRRPSRAGARSERTALSLVRDLARRQRVHQCCTSFSSPTDL